MKATFRTASSALLIIAALLVVTGPAQAHKKTYPANMTAAAKNKNLFEGKAIAKPICVSGRSVAVYNAAGLLLGTGTTDSLGNWMVKSTPDIIAGAYYADLNPKRVLKNRKHKHICAGLRVPFQAIL